MATQKQKEAARKNIKKAQQAWQNMSQSARRRAQPEGQKRKRPGTGGEGNFYRIEVRPKTEFTTFRTHDIGREGHLERLAGRRKDGSWETAAWLVSKEDAHVEDSVLVIDDTKVRASLMQKYDGEFKHVTGDIFTVDAKNS